MTIIPTVSYVQSYWYSLHTYRTTYISTEICDCAVGAEVSSFRWIHWIHIFLSLGQFSSNHHLDEFTEFTYFCHWASFHRLDEDEFIVFMNSFDAGLHIVKKQSCQLTGGSVVEQFRATVVSSNPMQVFIFIFLTRWIHLIHEFTC